MSSNTRDCFTRIRLWTLKPIPPATRMIVPSSYHSSPSLVYVVVCESSVPISTGPGVVVTLTDLSTARASEGLLFSRWSASASFLARFLDVLCCISNTMPRLRCTEGVAVVVVGQAQDARVVTRRARALTRPGNGRLENKLDIGCISKGRLAATP